MKNTTSYLLITLILVLFLNNIYAQENYLDILESSHLEDLSSSELLAVNASQYGMRYRETQILLQNRMGIRIEYTLDRSALELWLSPQAGKSMSYVDRNWSNRDDHTNIFDRILLPGCDLSKFKYCDWDPFHSIIYFEDQTLHISQIYDQPAVLVWFEKEGVIDFKIYGEEVERGEKSFIINHQDRGRDFQSVALLGEGEGYFQQQLELDKGRSIYTRAHMKPNQVLLISSELKKENISSKAKEWIKTPIENILSSNEAKITKDLSSGQFVLKNKPDMQRLMDKSRRVTLSMQDFKGFMRSTNQYIYYLMWFRDGGMNCPHVAYSGWTEPLYHHTKFALQNPNFTNENPDDIFFGQMMGGPLTKWQEDGLFYVVWPAFTHWTQTGDRSLIEGENLRTMERAMDWLERYCYDEKMGLFGRYFACETPMTGSRDDGWDNVTGAPTFKWGSEYEGQTITRSYDNYVNMLHYSTYIMLSAMQTDDKKAELYLNKAKNLEKNMTKFFDTKGALPSYGELLNEDGEMVTSLPYGMDIWDYVWGLALPTFETSTPERYYQIREQLRHDMTSTKGGYFHCVYFALLTSMDTEIHDEEKIMQAMDNLVELSTKPGKYLPMPDAVPEMYNISEENPFHDVRPLVYSIAPWLSAITNLGMHRLPYGIAPRATSYLEKLENFDYKGGQIDVIFQGNGEMESLSLNGTPLKHTTQIPDNLVKKGNNEVIVKMNPNAKMENTLVGSTVQLNSVNEENGNVIFNITAYGKNSLMLKNLNKSVNITAVDGKKVKYKTQVFNNITYVEFEGRGDFLVNM